MMLCMQDYRGAFARTMNAAYSLNLEGNLRTTSRYVRRIFLQRDRFGDKEQVTILDTE